ncbi:MAG: hypothetical protein ACXU82_00795 [Caulobacteraceae bacterium]
MKTPIVAAGIALLALTSFPAAAQPPGPPAAAAGQTAARYAVDKTPIRIIWADPKGHDVLLKELPDIGMYMDMIKDMTLIQVAPQSGGVITDEKLKAIQADLDALK